MAKHTVKVGISGKYGTRYGSSLRKQCKRLEVPQHARYPCTFCGRKTIKRVSFGIWKCHGQGCGKVMSGGAYMLATPAAVTARSTLRRLRDIATGKTGQQ
ncbi:60S ribosomal protein L37a [Sordaria brevicollis]|uniref:60S ribosomal protein L37a n=1 Tax=Sordaria brevicollis TaxID=83679 RepID=A0AAE0PP80_SORBR|nr:60S ribosomal protein L37a [Sordaria brevicollis]